MEALLLQLDEIARLMEKAQINLRKCSKARLTKGYLQARLQCIEEYWKVYTKHHHDLIKITPRDRRTEIPYFVNDEYNKIEEGFICMKGDIQDMLSQLQGSSTSQPSGTSSVNETSEVSPQVRLPRIQIPIYSGAYEEWPTFQDLFTSLVHNNLSLSDVQKLHYLKTSLAGEAESLLRHIRVTECNYIQAWETLKSRYGNKRIIVHSLLNRLFSHKKINIQSANLIKMLLDNTTECINTLNNLQINTDSWDPVIIFLIVQKLDQESRKDWENFSFNGKSDELPSWADLKRFLESKFRTLELVQPIATHNTHTLPDKSKEKYLKQRSFHTAASLVKSCVLCSDNHTLCHCKRFIDMSVAERNNYVKNKHLCFNCLSVGHTLVKCRLPLFCRVCHKRHHTLLHESKSVETVAHTNVANLQPQFSYTNKEVGDVQINTMMTSHCNTNQGFALLATALVKVTGDHGHTAILRALIDQGSQASLISERATQLLKLKKRSTKGIITGVSSTKAKINSVVQLQIQSTYNSDFALSVEAYVIPKRVTSNLPSKSITARDWPHLQDLQLADPIYNESAPIDMLLGVTDYAKIIQHELKKGPAGSPCAQKTLLGWILFGEVTDDQSSKSKPSLLVLHHQINIDGMLKSMWELDVDNARKRTQEERKCEEIYEKTHKRNEEGRYIVNLPFKTDTPKSVEGNSKEIAIKRFIQLERRLHRLPQLKEKYTEVIKDYINLGHAEEISEQEVDNKAVYLCHHAVLREDSESTPTRVVFDASCKGSNGVSLNDELLVGPVLQEDLRSIILRWRMHAVCFVSDLKKMYRMVLVKNEHTDFQRFLWRDNPNSKLKEYRLLTVTFGTAPAPYLAVKTLIQLAEDEGYDFPAASRILKEDTYVDDVLSGCDSVSDAISVSKELDEILQRGGFELQKWASNSTEFMKSMDENKRSTKVELNLNVDGTVKALGILWNLANDNFIYNLNLPPISSKITKRAILSDVQKLFDPLGWLAPCVVNAKILIQKLWLQKYDWDDVIEDNLKENWIQIRQDLENVRDITIERWIRTSKNGNQIVELHGFCDASEKAYAAVIYCRVIDADGTVTVTLQAARTKVSPVKPVSLPRLELCGAVLLSKLLKHVAQAMRIPAKNIFSWTDSTIVLSWLSGEPSRWKPFVANRVVEIIDNVGNLRWFHVESENNPADVASRGAFVLELQSNKMWWTGPSWLKESNISYRKPNILPINLELKNIQVNTNIHKNNEIIFDEFENLNELLRTIVYTIRFLNYKKDEGQTRKIITTEELDRALIKCIKIAQRDFKEEIESIKSNKGISKYSKIKGLNPYLDAEGILRVGGRLRNSSLSEDTKHPIILGNKHRLTYLIIAAAHKKTLHGGTQLVMAYLRSRYWIIQAKMSVKSYIGKCVICIKHKSLVKSQLMGDLPKCRTTPARAFQHSGVDFAGPLYVLMSRSRGARKSKAYIAVFICMATKAIHLELVGDMTSESFLGAFRRFVSRRGKCSHIWSDQGRNFVGANKLLSQAFQEAKLELPGHLAEQLSVEGTQWHFIPPYSPNFGGLWEAGVKSVKHHLRRILTNNLTYEEMTTTLHEIEACLNSRPLIPMDSSDPDALEPLTPGHFLIGEAPVNAVYPYSKLIKLSPLDRWQFTQKLVRDFWHRWQTEYLTRLQNRPKWLKQQTEFNIGDIVLIKDEHLPPGKWPLGRIVEKHPGPDGLTRVYSVKYRNEIVKRSISKLCDFGINDVND